MKRFIIFIMLFAPAIIIPVFAAKNTQMSQPKLEFNRAHEFRHIVFSGDGRFLITLNYLNPQEVAVYEATTMRMLRKFFLPGASDQCAVLPDGSALVQRINGKIVSVNLNDGTTAPFINSNGTCLAISADGKTLAVAENDRLSLYSYPDGKQLIQTGPVEGKIGRATFSPDGSYVALGTYDSGGRLYICSAKDGVITRLGGLLSGHDGSIRDMRFSADGRLLASADSNGKMIIWDYAAQKAKSAISLGDTIHNPMLYFRSEALPIFIFSGYESMLKADAASEKITSVNKLPVQNDNFAFSPDGSTFAMSTESDGGLPLLFSTADITPLCDYNMKRLPAIGACSLSDDGTVFAWVQNNKMHAVNTITGEVLRFDRQPRIITQSAINSDKMIAAFCDNTSLMIYSMKDQKVILEKKVPDNTVAVVISPDGRYVFCAAIKRDKTNVVATRIDTASGSSTSIITKNPKKPDDWRIDGQRVSPDGRYALFMPSRNECDLFDFASGKHEICAVNEKSVTHLAGDADILSDPAFLKAIPFAVYNDFMLTPMVIRFSSPAVTHLPMAPGECCFYTNDGKKFILGFDNGSVQQHDSTSFELLGTIALNEDSFGAIHPDGRYFGSTQGILSLFHWVTGNETVALNDFGQQFFTPGILNEIFTGKTAASSAAQKPKPAVVVQRQLIGKVFGFDGNSVIIASSQSGTLVRGGKLFVMPDDGGTIELTVSMPMHTSTKCAVKDSARKKMIRKGMPVFRD